MLVVGISRHGNVVLLAVTPGSWWAILLALAPSSCRTHGSASLAAIRSGSIAFIVGVSASLLEPLSQTWSLRTGSCRSSADAIVIVGRKHTAMVADASVVGTSLISSVESWSGKPASSASTRTGSCWLSVEVLFQDKDRRETSLPEAGSEQEIRCGHDFGSYRIILIQRWLSLELSLLLFHPFLLAALSNSLVTEGNQIRGILFHARGDSLGKLFQEPRIVLVLGAEVLDAHGSILGQLIVLPIIVGAGPLTGVCGVRKVHCHGERSRLVSRVASLTSIKLLLVDYVVKFSVVNK